MQTIQIQATPNQTLQTVVGGQLTVLNIYQKSTGLFMDVFLNTTVVITGVICENLNLIVRNKYLGYSGDFVFYDTQGTGPQGQSDPYYTGLGSRFVLVYLAPTDLPAGMY